MTQTKHIRISQADNGVWYVMSDDDERIVARFNTARHAAAQMIYQHLDGPLLLEITPYAEPEATS